MSIANEIARAQDNLKDCYDTCKEDGVFLPDHKNFDDLPALIEQYLNPFNKPSDWSDIRVDCPENSIALYAGHTPITMGPLPYTKVGTPTITGSIYTSSDSNYLIAKDCPKYCTFVAKITTGADVNSWQYVLSSEKLFDITIENGYLRCYKFNTAENIQLCAVSANTPYYIKAESYFDNEYNMKQFSVSLDGIDWTYGTTNFVDNAPDDVNDVYVGRHLSVDGYYFKGSFDLSDTYVKNTDDSYFIAPYVAQTIQYDNLGFTATCVGGYKVYIDGTLYNTYNSGSTCTITWSSLALATGDDITTPTALKAHKIWIEPATAGNNITQFRCRRVAASGNEEQGILWAHFNISNIVAAITMFGAYNTYTNALLIAITAKNNTLNVSTIEEMCEYTVSLEYIPLLVGDNIARNLENMFYSGVYNLNKVVLKNFKFGTNSHKVFYNSHIKEFVMINCDTSSAKNLSAFFYNNWSLEKFSDFDFSSAENMTGFMYNCHNLKDMILDVRAAKNLKIISCYAPNSNGFIDGLKGLRVSNEAPFTGTAPQINVNYTGMDRDALVQLFNDLPYNIGYEVVGSPTINNGVVSNITTTDYTRLSQAPDFSKPFELCVAFSLSEIISNSVFIFDSRRSSGAHGLALYLSSDSKRMNFLVGNSGSSWAVDAAIWNTNNKYFDTVNTKYYFKVVFTGSSYIGYRKVENGEWEEGQTIASTAFATNPAPYPRFGSSLSWGGSLSGSIYLNDTYIKENGVTWFNGKAAMTKTLSCVGCTGNQDKLTIVGSPTISNSMVSGFSESDYVYTSALPTSITTFEHQIKFTTGNSAPAQDSFFGLSGWGTSRAGFFINSNMALGTHYINFATNKRNIYTSNFILDYNTTYWAKWTYSSESIVLYFSTDGINWSSVTLSEPSTDAGTHTQFNFGNTSSGIFNGEIDLNNTYIKINDELWFGREQYLLPEDKDIAEKQKNWELTLAA